MYRVDRNNFHEVQKNATVYTPEGVANFIYGIVKDKVDGIVFDPCAGAGALLKPFEEGGFEVIGIDVEEQGYPIQIMNYLEMQSFGLKYPGLVIMNPPFNIDDKTKEIVKRIYGGRPLLPEIWLRKTIELFGKTVPMILFAPYGLRLNQTGESKRWRRFVNGEYPEITSIISLPKDIYDGVLFHSEVLVFNIAGLKPHYFYDTGKNQMRELFA